MIYFMENSISCYTILQAIIQNTPPPPNTNAKSIVKNF